MSQPTISSSDRIRDLSAINADIPLLISSAGHAVEALTQRPPPSPSDSSMDTDNPSDTNKAAFTAHTTAYFTTLQSIMARLRRQAYALEEAGIIASEVPTLSTTTTGMETAPRTAAGQGAGVRRAPQQQAVREEERVTNGGLGGLDTGFLNSRGNRVGGEKEVELAKEVRGMLERLGREGTDGV